MRRLLFIFAAVALLALHACTTGTSGPPVVSPVVIISGAQRHANAEELTFGRSLFVQRCIQCHALPQVRAYSGEQWRKIIPEMAERANLKPAEREALLAYLVAARSTL